MASSATSEVVKNLKLSDTVVTGVTFPTAGDLGLSTAYKAKGSITVAAANMNDTVATPNTTWEEGAVYNLSDSGTITNGLDGSSITVLAGDNIVRVKDSNSKFRWDKLSATVNVPGAGNGIVLSGGAYQANLGDGLEFSSPPNSSDGIQVAVKAHPSGGIVVESSGVSVALGTSGALSYCAGQAGIIVNIGCGLEHCSADNAIYVAPGCGIILSNGVAVNPGSNITTTSGVEVSLNKAANITGNGNLDNKTLGEIVGYLGGTVS